MASVLNEELAPFLEGKYVRLLREPFGLRVELAPRSEAAGIKAVAAALAA